MIIVYGMAGCALEAAAFMGHAAVALVDNNRRMFVSWVGTARGKPILTRFAKGSFSDPYYRVRIPTDEDGGIASGISATAAMQWIDNGLRQACAQAYSDYANEYTPVLASANLGTDPYGAVGQMYGNCVKFAIAVLTAAGGYAVLAANGCCTGAFTVTVLGLCQDAARMREESLGMGTNDPGATDDPNHAFFAADVMAGQNYQPYYI